MLDPNTDAVFRRIEQTVRDATAAKDTVRVLEAGAGTQTHITVRDDAYVVGIDNSQPSLDKNEDLDEKILGDLGTHDFGDQRFDVIVSVYVLEHVVGPDRIIDHLASLLAPGGVLVVVVPNVRTPKGVITKYTPHPFHVWVRRRLLNQPDAGKPGHDPFPTVLDPAIAPDRMLDQVARLGLEVLDSFLFEDDKQRRLREKVALKGKAWDGVITAVDKASGGRYAADDTEFVLIAPGAALTPCCAAARAVRSAARQRRLRRGSGRSVLLRLAAAQRDGWPLGRPRQRRLRRGSGRSVLLRLAAAQRDGWPLGRPRQRRLRRGSGRSVLLRLAARRARVPGPRCGGTTIVVPPG